MLRALFFISSVFCVVCTVQHSSVPHRPHYYQQQQQHNHMIRSESGANQEKSKRDDSNMDDPLSTYLRPTRLVMVGVVGAIVIMNLSFSIHSTVGVFTVTVNTVETVKPISIHDHHGPYSLQKLLLNVPFYVYEDLVWENGTWGGVSLEETFSPESSIFERKHSDDYWFMKNSLRHPMRTRNASKAKLFVIPSLHNLLDSRWYFRSYDLCWNGLCNDNLTMTIVKTLKRSPYFANYSKAHMAVASHYAHWKSNRRSQWKRLLQRTSNIRFESRKTNLKDRWSVPNTYVSQGCPLVDLENKTQDVAMIAAMKPGRKPFQDRDKICTWLGRHQKDNNTDANNNDGMLLFSSTCGKGIMCPTIAQSKLGFHVRGDTYGSNRLVDLVMSGTVPTFTLKQQYYILPTFIDWERISYFVDMEKMNETTFVQELADILNDTKMYQRKLNLLVQNRHLLDWEGGLYTFDLYMYMLQARLYPATRHDPATFFPADVANMSILKLPPPMVDG